VFFHLISWALHEIVCVDFEKTFSRRNLKFWLWPITSSVVIAFSEHREYNNFCVQLVQKFLILTEKINIEVLVVVDTS